jgi:hypothetical protein
MKKLILLVFIAVIALTAIGAKSSAIGKFSISKVGGTKHLVETRSCIKAQLYRISVTSGKIEVYTSDINKPLATVEQNGSYDIESNEKYSISIKANEDNTMGTYEIVTPEKP